jgi:serine/threonine protein kinase
MQLARGPNLHQLVIRRGALGLPLARLAARHLIAAVSYLHGRACIHRDIKPSNCILACNAVPPTDEYNWCDDDAIWSNGGDARDAILKNRWKVMLVDFGFARALEDDEIRSQRHLRNSIVYENDATTPSGTAATNAAMMAGKAMTGSPLNPNGMPAVTEKSDEALGDDADEDDDEDDDAILQRLAESAASTMRHAYEPTNDVEDAIMGGGTRTRRRESGISMSLPEMTTAGGGGGTASKRTSTARQHVRSMSALGTKAYAAPEIRKKLRHKTQEDFDKQNAAMTECVADYGMIVDAYSVGWTLRVAMTGVPPNFTISEYMRERDNVYLDGDESDDDYGGGACCCLGTTPEPRIVVRDPATLPPEATLLIKKMTEKNPEDRMTVREAQNQPWIAGGENEARYEIPQGDVPSHHGDPVVPLTCAPELSKLTIRYHMQ